jgi:hypothetical protein
MYDALRPPASPLFSFFLIFSSGGGSPFYPAWAFLFFFFFPGGPPQFFPVWIFWDWFFRLSVKRISLSLSLSFFFCCHWTLEEAMEDADGKERKGKERKGAEGKDN